MVKKYDLIVIGSGPEGRKGGEPPVRPLGRPGGSGEFLWGRRYEYGYATF